MCVLEKRSHYLAQAGLSEIHLLCLPCTGTKGVWRYHAHARPMPSTTGHLNLVHAAAAQPLNCGSLLTVESSLPSDPIHAWVPMRRNRYPDCGFPSHKGDRTRGAQPSPHSVASSPPISSRSCCQGCCKTNVPTLGSGMVGWSPTNMGRWPGCLGSQWGQLPSFTQIHANSTPFLRQ